MLASLALLGCSGSSYTYGGYKLYDHFPLDGKRSWEYASDDTSVDYKLEVVMSETTVMVDEIEVHEFQHFNSETGDQLLSVQWSSDSVYGILIHGYQTFAPGGGGGGGSDTGDTGGPAAMPEAVSFDNPVTFADPQMAPGETVSTSAGGWDFESTFDAVEPCENHWVGDDWQECIKITLEGGDAPFAGEYWIVPRYGIAWQHTSDDSDKWVLVRAQWEATD